MKAEGGCFFGEEALFAGIDQENGRWGSDIGRPLSQIVGSSPTLVAIKLSRAAHYWIVQLTPRLDLVLRKVNVLVPRVNKWDKVCQPCNKKGRSRSRTKTRVQIPLGPPP